MIDFYVFLGVDNNESGQEIKKAYRKLALKYHPDRHQGDANEAEEMMKLLNEAKDVLLNDEKREEYDSALYSFKQFKARQQQEAERRQREQAEQAERRQREQAEQAEWEKQTQEQHLRDEEAKAKHLVLEAEKKHNQEVLAHVLKKRNRLLLVFIVMVVGGIFYIYLKHQSTNEYLNDPYTAYGVDESAEVQIPPDLYDEPVQDEILQDTDNVLGSWVEEEVTDVDQPVLTNDHHDIHWNSQTDSSQPVPPQRIEPIEPKAVKPEPTSIPPKKKDDSLSIGNDDFFD
jgi:DNA polymerase III alpha subunit (gram-positive type)